MNKNGFKFYIALFFLICAIPAAAMFLTEPEEAAANQILEPEPELKTETGWNREFLRDVDRYVADHFAFRQGMITANARLCGLFGMSGTDKVILGKEGWLFFQETLDDYSGIATMDQRQLYRAVKNLSLTQEYLNARGKEFRFTIAPNKNSLYPEYMPYYTKSTGQASNAARLTALMEKEGIHYVDLFEPFRADSRVLYHRLDSHWTGEGAVLAHDLLMNSLERLYKDYQAAGSFKRQDFSGDLYEMAYPKGTEKDWEVYYNHEYSYTYEEPFRDVSDIVIHTDNTAGEGSLLMYRDSFGNALLPFMAEEFESACFSRASPYDLTSEDARKADTVILEMVERNLPRLAEYAPVLKAPKRDAPQISAEKKGRCSMAREAYSEDLVKISGNLEECQIDADSEIYIKLGESWYEASLGAEAEGESYTLYVSTEHSGGDVELAYKSQGRYVTAEIEQEKE
ncbi:hypothetical protein LI177_12950 [bacterium 210820-DFI.6.37]|nr:hypothetical protein [bacterium 210820-DFI.6.37]